jgi:IstB-like ATP binding protein
VNARYERGAMILTSNRGFAEWGEVFGDPIVAGRILDFVVEFRGTPRLHDALAWNEFENPTGDVAVPGGNFRADFVGHDRLAARHFRVGNVVEPSVVDFRRACRDHCDYAAASSAASISVASSASAFELLTRLRDVPEDYETKSGSRRRQGIVQRP